MFLSFSGLSLGLILSALSSQSAHADAAAIEKAKKLFSRITGVPIMLNDARLPQMEALIVAGKPLEAAAIATADEKFLSLTIKSMASVMSNKEESPYEVFNDFQAMFVGVARDDLDARTLLTGDFTYRGADSLNLPNASESDNEHYSSFESQRFNMQTGLVRANTQRNSNIPAAGVLTSRAWAVSHFNMGTNRRSVEHTFRQFMCTPIKQWRDSGLPDYRVRRDVDRSPGGNPGTFKQECVLCHAPMDGMSGAFARYDLRNGAISYSGQETVMRKYNQNGTVYPEGFVTVDDSWINFATQNHNQAFGWKGPMTGNGAQAFGAMISKSEGFKACMVKRAFREVCRKELKASDRDLILELSQSFEDNGFKFKRLFQEVAIRPECLTSGPSVAGDFYEE